MSIFSKFFRSPDERGLQQVIDKARKDATRTYMPLSNLGLAAVKASKDCRDRVGSFVEAKPREESEKGQMFAFFEFQYFFMHLTLRAANTTMTETEIETLQPPWAVHGVGGRKLILRPLARG
jgi:hypothetical protein